jgi:hypothetical protein
MSASWPLPGQSLRMPNNDDQRRGAKMTRRVANSLGLLSICASSILWWLTVGRISNGFLDEAFPVILLIALVFPAIAAWKASRLWLFMILSPVVLYIRDLSYLLTTHRAVHLPWRFCQYKASRRSGASGDSTASVGPTTGFLYSPRRSRFDNNFI